MLKQCVAVGLWLVAASSALFADPAYRAVLDRYCVTCHNQRLKTAGLTLDNMDLGNVPAQAEVWEKDHATEAELLESVKVLIAAGADVNAVNETGQTPLHYGAHASDDVVKFLAAHGARLDVKDQQGRTPVEMALGIGLHGHAGGPPAVREGTANLLRQLMAAQAPAR